MMGSCRGMSSSLQRSGNVSWCVGSESPTSVATALTATATPEEFSPQKHQSTDSGPIPLLLLSQAENTKRTHQVAVTRSHHSHWNQHSSSALYTIDKAPNSPAEEGEDGRKGNVRPPKADNRSKEDQSLLHPEDQGFLLPRSSPVISRRHRPLSWHGGGIDTSAPSSIPSPLDQQCCLAVTSVEDLASNPDHHSAQLQEDKKSRCVSVSSSLYRLLIAGLQLPISGQQGLAEEHRGRSLTSCDASHSSGRKCLIITSVFTVSIRTEQQGGAATVTQASQGYFSKVLMFLLGPPRHEESTLEEEEGALRKIRGEVAGSQGQSQIDKMPTSHQNSRVYEFSSADFRKQIDRDNEALIKLEKRKQVMAEYENRKHDEMMQSRWENCLKKDQDILLQRSLQKQSVAQYQVSQMKEREVLKQKERLQDQRNGQMLRRLDEQHAQKLAHWAEQQRESKMRNLKQRLDDIHERHLYTEKQREIIRSEEQKARLAQIESEQKLLQRKTEQVERFRRLQVPKQIVYDQLAASKKKQATAVALMEEQRMYVVEREAELAKQKKEREETRAAELQSVSAHRKTVIKDKELKKKAEQQRSVGFLQAAKEADRLSLAEEKLKAQKIREERLKADKVNVSLAAEKHGNLQQQKRDQFSAETRPEPTAVKGSHLQQDVQPEHKKLGRKQLQRLQLSDEDPNKIALGHVLLPPISKAAKDILAANNATRKGFGKFFSGEGSSYLSADTSEPLPRYSKAKPSNIKLLQGRNKLEPKQTRNNTLRGCIITNCRNYFSLGKKINNTFLNIILCIFIPESGVDTTLTQRHSPRNAEWLAQQLVLEFKRSWLPSNQPQHGRQSLHSSLQEYEYCRYPVSDFSKQLLASVWHQPLFDLTCVGKTLNSRVKELDKFRELQDQLLGVRKLLKACRFSGRVMTEFEQLPAHLMEQPHLFSMEDLLRVKKGQLVLQAKALLHSSIHHVENCELCLARGFICEFCRERDVIFPFQSDICKRCPACRACFHKHCFLEKKCPKCARIQSRKKRKDP
ncbi:uncharacterized protein LOC118338671 [Morone saxatilis]|uniref:uncharacterized protein LOC118338671 n=1 Tax=Morone saxatilis TaxID=34816 RepID=UPI0015E2066C|nr:uncharacterized protein LOC118338671 [Morone saxatilis]